MRRQPRWLVPGVRSADRQPRRGAQRRVRFPCWASSAPGTSTVRYRSRWCSSATPASRGGNQLAVCRRQPGMGPQPRRRRAHEPVRFRDRRGGVEAAGSKQRVALRLRSGRGSCGPGCRQRRLPTPNSKGFFGVWSLMFEVWSCQAPAILSIWRRWWMSCPAICAATLDIQRSILRMNEGPVAGPRVGSSTSPGSSAATPGRR